MQQQTESEKNITQELIKRRLQAHIDLIREYQTQLERLERLTASMTSPKAQSLDGIPGGGPTEGGGLALQVARKIELEAELGDILKKIRYDEAEVAGIIKQLDNAEERGILRLKYLDDEEWIDVAAVMYGKQPDYKNNAQGYLKRAYNKHGEAIAKLARLYNAPDGPKLKN